MRKNGKTEDTGRTPEPLEAAKPKRGRKPKSEKQQEETGAAAETEAVQEAGREPENAPEAAEKPAAETESTDAEQTGTPPEMSSGADTEPGNDAAEESAAEDENALEEDAEESNGTEESGEETEPKEAPESLPAPAMPTQVIESPLKLMKQEFSERAQIIREQMQNIQNAFISIGFQLHWIRENNMFRVLNYKNVYEYAEKEYGIKKTTCCNFISIVENYADRDEDGHVIESIADCYRNYSASQLVAMLGMSDEMKQQVSPDMSVRAINRLRKGEPEESPVEVENSANENAQEKENAPESPANNVVPTVEKAEQEKEGAGNISDESPEELAAYGNDIHVEKEEETGETGYGKEEPEEEAGSMEETPEGIPDGTLAEIDSYSDYQSMADELDLIMRHVFSVDAPVRVKIVCVQG